jgi:hypothetical protein
MVAVATTCISQAYAQPEPDTLWTKRFERPAGEGAYRVITTSDGGSLISGHSNLNASDSFLWLIRTDSNGDTLWTKTYSGIEHIPNTAKESEIAADGSFITATQTCSGLPVTGRGPVYLVRTGANGDSLWAHIISTVFAGSAELEILPDETMFVAGNDFSTGIPVPFLIKTDALGNPLWTRTYIEPTGTNRLVNDLLKTPDGGCILVGAIQDTTPPSNQQGLLIRVDTNGDTLWTRKIGSSATVENFTALEPTANGGFLATGRSSGFLYAAFIDSNGTLTMDTAYTAIFYNLVTDMLRPTANSYIVAGYGNMGAVLGPWITSLDDAGNVLWHDSIVVSPTSAHFAFGVSARSDGGLYLTGNTANAAFLIRTGSGAFDASPQLFTPNGGECLIVDEDKSIQWSIPGTSDNVLVQIDRNYPSFIWETLATVPAANGNYLWSVTGPLTYHARVRVILENNVTVADSSDEDFSIIYPGPLPLWTQQHFPGDVSEVYTDAFERVLSGFIVTGMSPLPARFVFSDVILVKTDLNGDSLWKKTYGGERNELSKRVIENNDGDFVFVAATESFTVGDYDIWVVKTDSNGDTIWTKTYGGLVDDIPEWIEQTDDRGYIITGGSYSFGAGDKDLFLLKLDSDGNDEWMVTHGGTGDEVGYEVHPTIDGGYIVAGGTSSSGAGSSDLYVLKTDDSGAEIWNYVAGRPDYDEARSVKLLSSGNFVVGATLTSPNNTDLFILELRDDGSLRWSNTIDKGQYEYCSAVLVDDDGFMLGGSTGPTINGNDQFLLVKTDFDGLPRWISDYGTADINFNSSARNTSGDGVIMAGSNSDEGYLVRIGDDGPVPCPSPDSVTVRVTSTFPKRNLIYWNVEQSGTYNIYSTTNMNLNTIPPGAGWTLEGSLYGIEGLTTSFADVLVGDPALNKKYVIRLICP